jgi:hypothetical protein
MLLSTAGGADLVLVRIFGLDLETVAIERLRKEKNRRLTQVSGS